MTISPTPATRLAVNSELAQDEFHTGQVLAIASGHFIHDVHTAFIAPILPLLIEKLSLSYTLVGILTSMVELPALLNPLVGYMADRISLRYFVIFAPALTATFVCLLGLAPSAFMVGLILLLTGVSTAIFHAPAPPMIARLSGRQVGRGMSYFMAAGELGRSVGPLIIVWAIGTWGLEGYWRLLFIGWGISVLLYWRLRAVPARSAERTSVREMLMQSRHIFIPLFIFVFLRAFMVGSLTVFLPTLMTVEKGADLTRAGFTQTIYELPGVMGALLSGALSSRLGQRRFLVVMTILGTLLMVAFLQWQGWLAIIALALLGFVTLTVPPVLLALVQENMPEHRAVANGILLMVIFLSRPATGILIGLLSDNFGLNAAFLFSALIALLGIPVIFWLPKTPVLAST